MALSSGEKRELKKIRIRQGLPKPPKHKAFMTEDGQVLHPTKGFKK